MNDIFQKDSQIFRVCRNVDTSIDLPRLYLSSFFPLRADDKAMIKKRKNVVPSNRQDAVISDEKLFEQSFSNLAWNQSQPKKLDTTNFLITHRVECNA